MKQQDTARNILLAYGALNVIAFLWYMLFFDPLPGLNILVPFTVAVAAFVALPFLLLVIPIFALPFAAASSVQKNGVWLPAASLLMPLVDLPFCVALFISPWDTDSYYYVQAIISAVIDLALIVVLVAYLVCRRKQKRQAAELCEDIGG